MNIKEVLRHSLVGNFLRSIKLNKLKRAWRKRNSFNDTHAMGRFNFENVTVGKFSYGELNVVDFRDSHKLIIGNYVSIAQNVTFLLNGEHYVDHISSFPFKVKVMGEHAEAFSKGDILVDDDVWIGYGASILSGVHIAQGAVVAAGAVVTNDVPPYAIVGGTPAKVIRYRFAQDVIDYLLTLDYGALTNELVQSNIELLYCPVDGMPLFEIQECFRWFPKKSDESSRA